MSDLLLISMLFVGIFFSILRIESKQDRRIERLEDDVKKILGQDLEQ